MSDEVIRPLAVQLVTGVIAASLALFARGEDETVGTCPVGDVSEVYQNIAGGPGIPGGGARGVRHKVNDQGRFRERLKRVFRQAAVRACPAAPPVSAGC